MLSDDELARLLQRLETDVPTNPAPIERVFERVDAERRATLATRRGFLARLALPRAMRWTLRPVAVLMLLSLLTGILVGGLFVAGQMSPQPTPQPSSIIRISPAARVSLDGRPYGVALFDGALWVANGGAVSQVDPGRAAVVGSIVPGPGRASVGAGGAGLWVGSSDAGTVSELDPTTNTIVRSVTVERPEYIAVGAADVWVASPTTGRITRIDAASGDIAASILVGTAPGQPTLAFGSVWIPHDCIQGTPDAGAGSLTRIDPATNQITGDVPGDGFQCVQAVTASRASIWFTDANDGTASEVDPISSRVMRVVEAGERAAGIVELAGSLWATFNPSVATSGLARIDPVAGRVTQTLDLGLGPERSTSGLTKVLALDGALWVLADFSGRPELLRVDLPR
jgi:virginiamycin B lyase